MLLIKNLKMLVTQTTLSNTLRLINLKRVTISS